MALVTLRQGSKAGFMVLLWVMLPALVFGYLGHPWMVLFDAFAGGFVLWLLASVLRSTESWVRVAQVGIALGVVLIALLHVFHPDIAQWWLTTLTREYHQQLLAFQHDGSVSQANELGKLFKAFQASGLLVYTAKMSTGFSVNMALSSVVVNLMLARWWQALLFNPGGFRRELFAFQVPYSLMFSLMLCGVGLWMKVHFAWDIMPVLSLVFLFAGLLLLHKGAQKIRYPWLLLVSGYVGVFVLLPYSLLALVLMGLGDTLKQTIMRSK